MSSWTPLRTWRFGHTGPLATPLGNGPLFCMLGRHGIALTDPCVVALAARSTRSLHSSAKRRRLSRPVHADMVLLGETKTLPPLNSTVGGGSKPTGTLSRGGVAKAAKSLGPRITDLKEQLAGFSSNESRAKGACCELALLASRSLSACAAVAEAELEGELGQILKKSADPTTQCWTLSVLSNCASIGGSRERQAVVVPVLCKLVQSSVPEVQHAAALHLATLSHSSTVQAAFGENQRALRMLHSIEGKSSAPLSKPGKASLQAEASQYARWALRTAQGRNYKPAYIPKSEEELAEDASVSIQARVRSSFVAQQYKKEMAQRKAAAVILQSGYRSHKSRADVMAEMIIQAPAAALLQGVMRGRAQRKRDLIEREELRREHNLAASRVQARIRGKNVRAKGLLEGPGEAGLSVSLQCKLVITCSDGELPCTLRIETDGAGDVFEGKEVSPLMTLKVQVADGPPLSFDLLY